MTIYADGIFGDFIRDDVVVTASRDTDLKIKWKAESAGTELFRIGVPDKSSGEFRHGRVASPDHPLLKEEYRLYWAAYDFVDDFPEGVTYKVGRDDPAKALNYVHWSVYGGKANDVRPEPVYDNINNWTILFDAESKQLKGRRKATFTVSTLTSRQRYLADVFRYNLLERKQQQEIPMSSTHRNRTLTYLIRLP